MVSQYLAAAYLQSECLSSRQAFEFFNAVDKTSFYSLLNLILPSYNIDSDSIFLLS